MVFWLSSRSSEAELIEIVFIMKEEWIRRESNRTDRYHAKIVRVYAPNLRPGKLLLDASIILRRATVLTDHGALHAAVLGDGSYLANRSAID